MLPVLSPELGDAAPYWAARLAGKSRQPPAPVAPELRSRGMSRSRVLAFSGRGQIYRTVMVFKLMRLGFSFYSFRPSEVSGS